MGFDVKKTWKLLIAFFFSVFFAAWYYPREQNEQIGKKTVLVSLAGGTRWHCEAIVQLTSVYKGEQARQKSRHNGMKEERQGRKIVAKESGDEDKGAFLIAL